jgi:hypothetical protein
LAGTRRSTARFRSRRWRKWRNAKWSWLLHKAALALCVVYFLGNLAIPGAVLAGKLRPQTAKVAATAQR